MHWKTTPAERHICVDLPGEVSRPHPHETAASARVRGGARADPPRNVPRTAGPVVQPGMQYWPSRSPLSSRSLNGVVGVNLPRQRLLGVVEQASSGWRFWQRASPTCGRAAQLRSPGSMPSRQGSRPPSGAVRRLPRSGPGSAASRAVRAGEPGTSGGTCPTPAIARRTVSAASAALRSRYRSSKGSISVGGT